MKSVSLTLGILTLFLTFLCASQTDQWDYNNDPIDALPNNKPDNKQNNNSHNISANWSALNDMYLGCTQGNQQSPINISSKSAVAGAKAFKISYAPAKGVNLRLENHTFKITYPKGSYIDMENTRYFLDEIFLKTPAENHIDNNNGLMEAQFFHKDSKGKMLILSVIFTEGRVNNLIKTLVKNLPTEPNKSFFITNIDINELLPHSENIDKKTSTKKTSTKETSTKNPGQDTNGNKNLSSFQFYGSLTYPPCSQDIYWIVLKKPIQTMKKEVDMLQEITGNNARWPQNVYDRLIVH